MKKRDRQRKKMTEEIQWLRPSPDFDFKAGYERWYNDLERDMYGVQDNERAGEVFTEHALTVLALMRNYILHYKGPLPLQRVGLQVSNGKDVIFQTTLPVEKVPLWQ